MLEESSTVTEGKEEELRPLDVNDALTYLDRVKKKFALQPDIYDQFLDIMKDFKSQLIDTPGVIERVSRVFNGDRKLISGFNTFLPPGYSVMCSSENHELVIKVNTPSGTANIYPHPTEQSTAQQDQPQEIALAIGYVHKIKNRFMNRPEIYKQFLEMLQDYQKGGEPIQKVYEKVKVLLDGSVELLDEFKQFLPEPKLRRKREGSSPSTITKRIKHDHPKKTETSDIRSEHPKETETSDVRSDQVSQEMKDHANLNVSREESRFLRKIRTLLDDPRDYNELVGALELFNMNQLDKPTLVNRVQHFMDTELMNDFERLIGNHEQSGSLCGPTYRYIPKVHQNNQCSGRDSLCWNVLNDAFVARPSRPKGIKTSNKKNQHEEVLSRIEEQRYDYDLNIEASLNTVALLEPIHKKINQGTAITEQEQQDLKVTSKAVYRRILKKIYGRQKGLEMIKLLETNPERLIPIVLGRLRQKEKEWKRSQREWNKIWREVEAKNYWKALDHQGISFKLSDRKNLTIRSFTAQAKREAPFEFYFKDLGIFKDISRLVQFFLKRRPVYVSEDCESMLQFMNMFIPMMFDVEDVAPTVITPDDVRMEETDDDDDQSAKSLSTVMSNKSKKGKKKDRVEKDLCELGGKSSEEDRNTDEACVMDDVLQEESTKDKKENDSVLEDSVDAEDIVQECIADNGLYCFFRLYQVLYSRLYTMKSLDQEFRQDESKAKRVCKEAFDLGITKKMFDVLEMDTKKGHYNILLVLINHLFEGQVNQQTFEEGVRYLFGNAAYVLFTIEKLVLSLVRYIHIIIIDPQSQSLVDLFKAEHRAEELGEDDIELYKSKVFSMMDSPVGNLYQISFQHQSRKMSIQSLDNDDYTIESAKDYTEYVAHYFNWSKETKGINQSSLKPSFLKRNRIKKKKERKNRKRRRTGLKYKICRKSYHMLYVTGSEDVYTRNNSKPMNNSRMNTRWNQWLSARFNENPDPVNTEEQAKKLYQ